MLKGAVLYAKDLDRLVQFYLAIGGKKSDGTAGEYTVVSKSGNDLILLQVPQEIASQIILEDPPALRASTPLKPVFETPSIDDTLALLPKFGGRPMPGSKRWKFGNYLVQDIVDPEGNVIQLWQLD